MLPSEFPSVQRFPELRLLLADQVDMQIADLRVLLRLPLPDLSAGCNFAAAQMLFGIIAGASVCFFEATTKALSDRRDRGRRFKALLTHFYPWGDDCLAATDCVHVLYDLARNPLTHSLGLGNGPHVTGIRQVSILKWPISGEQIEELERAHVRPIWTRPTIDRPRLPQARGEVVLSVPTLYWGVHRTLHALFQDERQIASADALVAHLRNEWAQYRLDAPL